MKLVSVAEMQAIEREANAGGLTYEMMMEHAGNGLADIIAKEYGFLPDHSIVGLVGSGNNGGDTLVALALLARQGWKSSAYLVRPRPISDPLVRRLGETGGQILDFEADPGMGTLSKWVQDHTIVLDGILGTGIQLPLRGTVAEVLSRTGQVLSAMPLPPRVVAVDCPSGVDCDTGQVAPECLPAELTVTMAAVKVGVLKFPANDFVGELRVVSIGLAEDDLNLTTWRDIHRMVADTEMIRRMLPERSRIAHKGSFGTVMVAAGSVNFTGAAMLAGKAAYRIGAGLVTLAVPEPLHSVLAGEFPEATWLLLPDETGVIAADAAAILLKNLDRVTTLLVGPGLGLEETTRSFLMRLFGTGHAARRGTIGFIKPETSLVDLTGNSIPPVVVDADGLKLLSRIPDWQHMLPEQAILTPHPGEMAGLTGLPVADIQADRINFAEHFSREWAHVVVLKGANTVVAAPDGQTTVIPVATPALARAGTGDVLAGLIAGLRAQGLAAFPSAVAGAWIHAQCGLRAARSLGTTAAVLAGDLLDQIAPVLSELSR